MFREHPSRTLNHRLPGRANFAVTRLTVLTVTPMIVLTMIMLSTLAFAGDERNPLAGDAKSAKAGEYQFRINCALCHGLGAHGGGRGPDLTRAHKKHTHSDAEMFQVISNGIPGTAMPANGTNGQPGTESSVETGRQYKPWEGTVLRRCQLLSVPHG
jgi:cytochrome c5